jgi:hypothetical protein
VSLRISAAAATQVQYGPQDQALKTTLGQAQQLQKDTGDWYAQYQAAANQLKTDLGNNATQATTRLLRTSRVLSVSWVRYRGR